MDPFQLKSFCQTELGQYSYSVPDGALGRTWSAEKVQKQLAACQASLVEPYEQRIEVNDTYEQMQSAAKELRAVWIVADDNSGYRVFFDPIENEFGLAMYDTDNPNIAPSSIGVRGDFVGTFMAR